MQTRLVDLVLNLLRKAQYQGTTPSDDELYLITDDYGVTSADVINALGYTPYNASNPDGYLNTQTVGDATVNIVQDNATVGSLTTNQTQDSDINIKGLYDYYYLDLTSVGTPTINNAVVSNFSTTNYVKMKTTYTMPSGWELWLNFTTASIPSESDDNYQYLIGGDSANPDFAVYINEYDKLTIQCGANTYTTSIELRSNATFNLRIIWNYDEVYGANPNGYCIELYDADMEYLTDEFINNATSPSTVNLLFGYSAGAAIGFKGSINFGKTYINKIESGVPSLWWKPTTPLIDTKADKGEIGARNIGEIVASAIPLTDAGLHLLDGSLISGSGSYSAFVDYIADIYDGGNYPNLFDTEANWQSAVTQYGVCGKFVYDSVNNTVRLPKITGIVEGTTNVSALGDLVEAGLPNITGSFGIRRPSATGSTIFDGQGVFSGSATTTDSSSTYSTSGGTTQASQPVGFDASLSNSIYGSSSTVQPQTIKVLYYIVVATSTKTNIEVDIDEIATDLNGKADVDGSNMVNSVKNFDGGWVFSNLNLVSGGSIPSSSAKSFDLSSYLPNDGYNYEVWVNATGNTGTTSGNGQTVALYSNLTNGLLWYVYRTMTRSSSAVNEAGTAIIPIGSDRILYQQYYANTTANTGTYDMSVKGYRRLGTNQ